MSQVSSRCYYALRAIYALAEHASCGAAAGRDVGQDRRDRHGFIAETQIVRRITHIAIGFPGDDDVKGDIAECDLRFIRKPCRFAFQNGYTVHTSPIGALVAQEEAGTIAFDHAMNL